MVGHPRRWAAAMGRNLRGGGDQGGSAENSRCCPCLRAGPGPPLPSAAFPAGEPPPGRPRGRPAEEGRKSVVEGQRGGGGGGRSRGIDEAISREHRVAADV